MGTVAETREPSFGDFVKTDYKDYVSDAQFLTIYNAYQSHFAKKISQRDKATIEIVRSLNPKSVLDVGCSTGNLLLHMSRLLPGVALSGCDLAESSLEQARKALPGVEIGKMDMLDLNGRFDVVVSNAVTYLFTDEQFAAAAMSVCGVLNPGGAWIDFDYFSPHDNQRITVHEVTNSHPHGIDIHMRPFVQTESILRKAGFQGIFFKPFDVGIDIPFAEYTADPITYTRTSERLQFRGVLYQPWHHLIASKPSSDRRHR